ncbi:MAG: 1-acyl-sn-glycerol-3-phosphate acyltransferase [Bacilli bacterium]|nr:1-acyl-sn-glycerol-3-phosphate acyltransferase [Bacilli bacterium]
MSKKDNKWIHKRHLRFKKFLYVLLKSTTKNRFGYTWEDFDDINNRNYLILYNHVTNFDQFMLGYSFKDVPIYYVATEDLFSIRFVSPLIKHLVNPIPFRKSTNDIRAVMNCVKVAKEGGSIAIAAEGNRTYSGTTESIKPSIAKLVKALKLPIAFFIIEGGYGVKPRWADDERTGHMHGCVKKVLEYEDYKDLSNEELYEVLKSNLYHDDTVIEDTYKSKHQAEYLERVLYVCPKCGLSKFHSKKDKLKCVHCDLELTYNEKAKFEAQDENFKFKTVKEWYDYQNDFINNFDLMNYDGIIYRDKVKLSKVIVYKKKQKIAKCDLIMYKDHYEFVAKKKQITLSFDDVYATSVLGKNKFNVYIGDDVYQIKADKRFNAVKYVNIYYRYKNLKENNHEQFLGL